MITVEDWCPADGLTLEPNAVKAATEQNLNLALTAGPGAGKTEMLAQRADFLLRTGSCRYPQRILAISFKVDAARNLKERVKHRCGNELASRFDSHTFHAFAKRIIDRFRPVLTGEDALDSDYTIGSPRVSRKQIDFIDLVPLATQIIEESPVARNAIRQTYSDVFLDEFQDCTKPQYKFIKVAFENTDTQLTAVGDIKQIIMSWAGALNGVFATFSTDFSAESLSLYMNFRSKPKLLRMQNKIIQKLDPSSMMSEEQLIGDEGEIFSYFFGNAQEEAEYIADQVNTWINDEHIPPAEIAILISKQIDLYAASVMAELEKFNIPFRNEQDLQDISAEPVARLIVDYLLCLLGDREPAAWTRLMTLLVPFTDSEEEEAIHHQGWQKFMKAERIEALQDQQELSDPSRWHFVERFIEKVGSQILTALSPDYESPSRLKDLISETGKKITSLLEYESNLVEALTRFSEDQAVRILTIHKSKGLEFHSVVIMAVEEEIFFGNQDENRCAFFVGVSRAKDRLLLSHAEQRPRPEGYGGRWSVRRTPQSEYLGYAQPFLDE